MRDQLDRGEKPTDGKKTVKAQDVVRMYENMIQSLAEIPSLAGLEEDEKLSSDIESKITFYKAFRSYYIALAFIASQKWAEAMAVFQRSLQYVAEVRLQTVCSLILMRISFRPKLSKTSTNRCLQSFQSWRRPSRANSSWLMPTQSWRQRALQTR